MAQMINEDDLNGKLTDKLWRPLFDEGYEWELPNYWEHKKEEAILTSVRTATANWTTNMVLNVYKHRFPWGWVRTHFGIEGDEQTFGELLNSQPMITVPSVFLFMFGLGSIGLIAFMRHRQKRVIPYEDLAKHMQIWKWVLSVSLFLSCFFVGFSAIQFLQTMSPVIKTGVFVLSNISLTSVEDLDVYRSKIVAETDYFFSTYLRENFDALYNFKEMGQLVVGLLPFAAFKEIHNNLYKDFQDDAAHMELIRHNIFDVIHESITLTADYKSALDVIDSEIQTSRDLCESIAQGGCTEIAGDIQARIRVPDETRAGNFASLLRDVDAKFLGPDQEKMKNWVQRVENMFIQYLKLSPVGDSLKAIDKFLKTDADKIKNSYGIEEGLPLTANFSKKARDTWNSVRRAQQKHYIWVYAVFLVMVVSGVSYGVFIFFCNLLMLIETRNDEFPCYHRTKINTAGALFLIRTTYVSMVLLFVLAFITPLSLIGGTFGTVFAESIYTREIFDRVIEDTPLLNKTFRIQDVVINNFTAKETLVACELGDPGIFAAINANLPPINIDVSKNIPTLDMVTSYMSLAVRTVAAKSLPAEIRDPAREFLESPLPTVEQLNNITTINMADKGFLSNKSNTFAFLAVTFTESAEEASNPGVKAEYNSLADQCTEISRKLSALDDQLDDLQDVLRMIATDVGNMIGHYNTSHIEISSMIENLENMSSELRNYDDNEALSSPLLEKLQLVESVFEKRSLKVLRANLGRCSHIAYIYNVLAYLCYFTAVRYANVAWVSLIMLTVTLSICAIQSVLIYRYHCEYEGIEYVTESVLRQIKSRASSVRFGKKDGKKGSSRHGRGELRGAAGEKAKDIPVEEKRSFDTLFKSTSEVAPDVKIIRPEEVSHFSFDLQLSECETPLVMPERGSISNSLRQSREKAGSDNSLRRRQKRSESTNSRRRYSKEGNDSQIRSADALPVDESDIKLEPKRSLNKSRSYEAITEERERDQSGSSFETLGYLSAQSGKLIAKASVSPDQRLQSERSPTSKRDKK